MYFPINCLQRLSFGSEIQAIEKAVDKAQLFGHWILLEDIKLGSHSLSYLNAMQEKLTIEIDKNFRLFILITSDDDITIEILHTSVKFAYETNRKPSKSISETITTDEIQQLIERNLAKSQVIQNILYFCSLNSLIRERCSYRHYGWNLPYDFIESDLLYGLFNLEQMTLQGLNSKVNNWNELSWIIDDFAWGARVCDQQDFHRLRTLSKQFFLFYLEHCGCLKSGTSAEVFDSVTELCSFNQMHPDQEFTDRNCANDNFISIKSIQHIKLVDENNSDEELLLKDKIAQILDKLPDNALDYAVCDNLCIKDVVIQEINDLNEIINIIKSTLQKLSKFLNGNANYSIASDDIQFNLLNGIVPVAWYTNGFKKTKSLSKWIKNVQQRIQYFSGWNNKNVPLQIWLGAFSYPQAFLVAIKQIHARKYQLSLIDIDFQFVVIDSEVKVLFLNTFHLAVLF